MGSSSIGTLTIVSLIITFGGTQTSEPLKDSEPLREALRFRRSCFLSCSDKDDDCLKFESIFTAASFIPNIPVNSSISKKIIAMGTIIRHFFLKAEHLQFIMLTKACYLRIM